MADQEKSLILRPGELDARALAAFERARLFDTSGGLASIRELLEGATVYVVEERGEPVCHYGLRVQAHAHGAEGVIVAAAGHAPGLDLTASVLPGIERQFVGVRAIKATTARPGLVLKMAEQGYHVEAYILRKRLEH